MDLPTVIEGRDPTAEEHMSAASIKKEYRRKHIGSGILIWELKSKKCCCKSN